MFSFPFLQNPCKKKRYKWKEMTWFIYLASDFLQRKQKRQKFQDEKHSYMNNNKYEYQIDIKYFWVVTKNLHLLVPTNDTIFIYLFILKYFLLYKVYNTNPKIVLVKSCTFLCSFFFRKQTDLCMPKYELHASYLYHKYYGLSNVKKK